MGSAPILGATVETVRGDAEEGIDPFDLEERLVRAGAQYRLVIGAFCAVSNVTGARTNVK